MEKVLVELFVPSIQKSFEIMAPQDVPISRLTGVLADGVRQMCPERFTPLGNEALLIREFTRPLDPAKRLCDYGACDGAHLVLM
ncbi:MAG: EsaB/YukD family protein [Clostridiales bacterium]|nr:EsaB/YukD family protein [Clostridiales bacterium]